MSQAREAQQELRSKGVDAEYVDGKTPDEKRRDLFRSLGDGSIDYLCNVGVVERGTDIPAIGCVQLCTAVGSVVRYRQMIGRGSRVCEDKTDCVVIDHGKNIADHGFFEDDPEWTLDLSKTGNLEHNPKAKIECPQCQAVYRGGKCRQCGYEPTPKERRSQGLEFNGGELKEIKPAEKPEKGKKTNEQILVSMIYSSGRRNGTWRMVYARCCQEAEKQGTRFKCPREFQVGGRTYKAVQWDSPDKNRRVRDLYPFVG